MNFPSKLLVGLLILTAVPLRVRAAEDSGGFYNDPSWVDRALHHRPPEPPRGPNRFDEIFRHVYEASQKIWKNDVCRRAILTVGTVTAISVAAFGSHNWGYPEGEWKNTGTETAPAWVPQVGDKMVVEERLTALTIPSRHTLWVHNGENGFGVIRFEENRIVYSNAGKVVAQTETINPFGRPLDADHPISVRITDGQGNEIGRVLEVAETSAPETHQVHFEIHDAKGHLIGRTDGFRESDRSKIEGGRLKLHLESPDGLTETHVQRGGWLGQVYRWSGNGTQDLDPRLIAILSAYKTYVEDFRN